MATTLKLSFSDVYEKVGEFLGIPSLTDAADITRCKKITLRGYRRFLMPRDLSKQPPVTYRWYFLQKTSTLSIESGVDTYKLATGFSSLVCPFTHIIPLSYNPQQKPLSFIYLQKSMTTGTGYPRYFALKTSDYDALTGQFDNEVMFSPTPSASFSYYYTYHFIPPPPEKDDDVFIGDTLASECILECALAVAELEKDDTIGVHNQAAENLLQSCIGEDKRQGMVGNLGSMNIGKIDEYIRSATVYEQGTWSGGTFTQGTQILPEP